MRAVSARSQHVRVVCKSKKDNQRRTEHPRWATARGGKIGSATRGGGVRSIVQPVKEGHGPSRPDSRRGREGLQGGGPRQEARAPGVVYDGFRSYVCVCVCVCARMWVRGCVCFLSPSRTRGTRIKTEKKVDNVPLNCSCVLCRSIGRHASRTQCNDRWRLPFPYRPRRKGADRHGWTASWMRGRGTSPTCLPHGGQTMGTRRMDMLATCLLIVDTPFRQLSATNRTHAHTHAHTHTHTGASNTPTRRRRCRCRCCCCCRQFCSIRIDILIAF